MKVNCPLCDTPLGPVLKAKYSNLTDMQFCHKCVRFIEVTREDIKASDPPKPEKKT